MTKSLFSLFKKAPSTLSVGEVPKHVAMIMDGNGRWAAARGLKRLEGHKAGAKTVRTVVEECRRLGVRYLTLYTFSSENWRRPKEEVSGLMGLLARYLESELKLMLDNGIRLRAIGDRSLLSPQIVEILERVEEQTRNHQGMDLVLALSYGGRQEILNSAKFLAEKVKNGELSVDQIDEEHFRAGLYSPDVPDPDLLIRTGGEMRVSNFLLWQVAYSEIVVTEKKWPEFSREDLLECFNLFSTRQRRYGLTGEQINEGEEAFN